jgi:hypothetical protein
VFCATFVGGTGLGVVSILPITKQHLAEMYSAAKVVGLIQEQVRGQLKCQCTLGGGTN